MTLDEFAKDFSEDVRSFAYADGNFTRSAFVDCCAARLQDANIIDDFVSCFFKGSGERNRNLEVDGYCFDDIDDSLSIFIADYRGFSSDAKITKTESSLLFGKLKNFLAESLSGKIIQTIEDSHPAHGLALDIFQKKRSLTRIRLYIVTDAIMSDRIKDLPEDTLESLVCEYHIWDMARFHRAASSPSGTEELEVDFSFMTEGGVPSLSASVQSDEYRAYLCVLPANVLADIYDRYGSRLLEGNVRSFLSNKVKVNRAIRQTILTAPSMFFAYNNGIACTASAVEVIRREGLVLITKAVDLQIVNGGQSTASLSNARRHDKANLEGVFIQMKLSVVPPETSVDVVPAISRCANSQNKVSDADFFSNHEFHRRLESFSRKFWAPATSGAQHETHWFYERARGQYLNEQSKLAKRDRDRFVFQNPRSQVVTKTDLAKYENSWRQLPHEVSLGAQKNFAAYSKYAEPEWSRNADQFNELFFKEAMARARLFRATEELVSEESWYEGGYRANIVAYSIARLARLIEEQLPDSRLDFGQIWTRQRVGPAVLRQLSLIGETVARVISAPPSGFSNISEWCKKEACWAQVYKVDVVLAKGLQDELVLKDHDASRKRSSIQDQRFSNGIERQTLVLSLGPEYWSKLLQWATGNSLLTPDEQSIVKVAAAIPLRLPSEKQSWRLIDIRDRAEEEGFRP
jgi:hypothetical protein